MRSSDRSHWERFWSRDRKPGDIYGNDGRIAEEIPQRTGIRGRIVLEVGAATARDSAALADLGAVAVALDYSPAALRVAREATSGSAGVLLVCGDALALPFRSGSIDVTFSQGVLEHFREPMPVLAEQARVLRQGGVLLADVPQTFHPYTVMKKILIVLGAWFAGWETQFTRRSLSSLISRAGLAPFDAYGRFFHPSLSYRLLREAMFRIGVRIPLRPVIIPAVSRLRGRIRRAIEKSPAGTSLGSVIGVFARKEGSS
jgi:SAM-dependent methyltransferase